ncbi:hypothetical protein GCM10027160_01630 [Streptomyces calidiresistens]|uniref:DUF4267 domain-containing protein n=1 Tax=Streptomyces calidiresistens TaxID=1485586 RepID=A0A7W3T894_9ACTN|nr:hypothetical protein [Streptomyces calidiresistens]MBB0232618.1 hypothetical protein [Streptomyces calidiresistens]
MRESYLRLIGAATAAYGLAVAVRPELLARPSGLVDRIGQVAPETATSLRPLAWRDAANGLAMALAPNRSALKAATALRIASDFGDAVLLAATLPERRHRIGAVAVSVAWGALSVAALASRPPADAARVPTPPPPVTGP